MNSFTDGKPLETAKPAPAPVVLGRPRATPRYGLFGFLAILGLLGYIIYDLQASKKQLREAQQTQMAALEAKLASRLDDSDKEFQALTSDFKVVRDRLGVTQRELDNRPSGDRQSVRQVPQGKP